jgi:hypothetical protein
MKSGDAFLIKNEFGVYHLYIVISDTEQNPNRVICVMLTTWEDWKEDACLLDVGDHPFVRHKSCISYHGKMILETTKDELEKLVNQKLVRTHEPVSDKILERIRQGAAQSNDIENKYLKLLKEQGLIH